MMLTEITPFDAARAMKKLFERYPELTAEWLAEKLGKPTRWVRDRMALNRLAPEIEVLYDTEVIGLQTCCELGYLPPERQFGKLEKLLGRRIWRPLSETRHELSLFVPNDGSTRHMHLTELVGMPESVRICYAGEPTEEEIQSGAARTRGATMTWRFGDADQLLRTMGYAARLGMLGGIELEVR
jgi:hypothetical protein